MKMDRLGLLKRSFKRVLTFFDVYRFAISIVLAPVNLNFKKIMKKFTLFMFTVLAGFGFQTQAQEAEIILSQTSGDVTPQGVSCAGADNYWLRNYDLANHGLTSNVNLTGVQIGVQNLDGPEELEVYVWEYVGFPGGFDLNDLPTPLAAGEIEVDFDDLGTLVNVYFAEPVEVFPDSYIVVAVVQPEETGNELFLMTLSEESQTSYIASFACGLEVPEPVAAVGFPDAHHIINLIIDDELSTNDVLAQKVSVYPNPVTDVLNINLPSDVVVNSSVLVDVLGRTTGAVYRNGQMDVSGLSQGVYFLKLETNLGSYTQKVVKQ